MIWKVCKICKLQFVSDFVRFSINLEMFGVEIKFNCDQYLFLEQSLAYIFYKSCTFWLLWCHSLPHSPVFHWTILRNPFALNPKKRPNTVLIQWFSPFSIYTHFKIPRKNPLAFSVCPSANALLHDSEIPNCLKIRSLTCENLRRKFHWKRRKKMRVKGKYVLVGNWCLWQNEGESSLGLFFPRNDACLLNHYNLFHILRISLLWKINVCCHFLQKRLLSDVWFLSKQSSCFTLLLLFDCCIVQNILPWLGRPRYAFYLLPEPHA